MFKDTSRQKQFRLRPKQTFSSDDARRWAFYAQILYEEKHNLDPYRQGRLERVRREIISKGELDYELPWFRDTFIPWLGEECRRRLEERYIMLSSWPENDADNCVARVGLAEEK